MSDAPLLITAATGCEIARIAPDGRAFYRGFRVPRRFVFFVAAWRMAKSAEFIALTRDAE